MEYFKYSNKEVNHLKSKCEKLAQVIDRIGYLEREIIPDPFVALISSVASQQISGRAAESIWRKFIGLIGEVTPENILSKRSEEIRGCGFSSRKTEYIIGIADAAKRGVIDFDKLSRLDDEQVKEMLVKLKGVGEWTADMILLFSLKRPNILSYGDSAIIKGLSKLHEREKISKEDFEYYKELYSPYCSVASLYIWELQNTPK
ncbi:MAG: DNA-3-methyladenine glycosylase 2 family protein [Bacteroidetes bacterium HGW-Bacteroidetes-8]|jgi:3-methyladenine DNA glycosylase/8-oxoguanine DNA glycosylase|nr:MAG: DNA-3-methyladenine glycosylase 2 family protein [Bacteroidetes bacterium HGW-Bacteroidetes-8]